MKKQTEGAWIIHHTKKLQGVDSIATFDEIHTAGKCGILLSALAESENNNTITKEKVRAIATANKINTLELPSILSKLESGLLIEQGTNGDVHVLGLPTSEVLNHTSTLFERSSPSNLEKTALEISELISSEPRKESFIREFIADTAKLSKAQSADLISECEQVGFIDSEKFSKNDEKLFFNGNLFRKESLEKADKVLSTLNAQERSQYSNIDTALSNKGCVPYAEALAMGSDVLLSKLASIGMIDISQVANDAESQQFVTKPTAFSKFGSPFEEDALDLAKSFVASLSYGMIYSYHGRGKIYSLSALVRKLLRGQEVGPTTSIGQDYKVLEFNRVIELRSDPIYPKRFWMRLLKKEVGELALKVLETGDAASEESILDFQSTNLNQYFGPEYKRTEIRRKKVTSTNSLKIYDALNSLRITN